MNKFILLIITSLIILTSCQQANVAVEKENSSTIQKITERKILNVGTSGQYFPFSFKNANKELRGIDIYLGKKLAKELDVEVKFIELDINGLTNALKNNEIDIILSGYSITTERNKDFLFTESYYETGKSIISRVKEIKSGDKEFINRKEVTLVTTKNSSSLDFIKEHYPNATVITKKSISECAETLFSGEANGFVGDYELCENMFFSNKNNGDYNFRNLGTAMDHEYIGAALSPNDFHFHNLVNNFIKKIDENTLNKAIEEAWLEYGN